QQSIVPKALHTAVAPIKPMVTVPGFLPHEMQDSAWPGGELLIYRDVPVRVMPFGDIEAGVEVCHTTEMEVRVQHSLIGLSHPIPHVIGRSRRHDVAIGGACQMSGADRQDPGVEEAPREMSLLIERPHRSEVHSGLPEIITCL